MGNHALVFGASGITGWGTANALLSDYPSADSFDKVTALTNRPLSAKDAQWPPSKKLTVVSGLDLKGEQSALVESMKANIPSVETVSHIYFFAYIFDPDADTEILINVDILKKALVAVESLSDKLVSVVLPTGVKTYGCHLLDKFPYDHARPLKETLPPIPEPYASKLFYYPQIQVLKNLSAGKKWTWCDVIPDIVVGFVPNNNAYCLAQWLALYLSLYREINGPNAEVEFPGSEKSWKITSNDSNQDIIGRFAVYASLHPEKTSGERYNVADNAQWSTWEVKWPIICEYFGLRGVGPPAGGSGPDPSAYVHENREKWFEMERKYNLRGGRVGNEKSLEMVPIFLMRMFDFDREIDLTKMHEAWGDAKEETDVQGAWHLAFDRFRAAKIIP